MSVSGRSELDPLPGFVQDLHHVAQRLLLRSLSRNRRDVLLELNGVQVNQRLESELRVSNVEVTVYQVLYLLPMVLLKGLVTQGNHNRHRTLEGIH